MTPDSPPTPSSGPARSQPASPAFAAAPAWVIGSPGSDRCNVAKRASSCSPCGLPRRCVSTSTGMTRDSSRSDRVEAGTPSSAAATTSITGLLEPETGSRSPVTTVTTMERRTGTTSGAIRTRPGSWLDAASLTSVQPRSTFRTGSDPGRVPTSPAAVKATGATSLMTCGTPSSRGSKYGPLRPAAWPAIRSTGGILHPLVRQLRRTCRQLDDVKPVGTDRPRASISAMSEQPDGSEPSGTRQVAMGWNSGADSGS